MLKRISQFLAVTLALVGSGLAASVHAPDKVVAGTAFSISTDGNGHGTLYLVGPASAIKRDVELGGSIQIDSSAIEKAGRYTATVCAPECSSTNFYVVATEPSRISLLVHPSRVPVADNNAISAVAVIFDHFHNLEVAPIKVQFKVIPKQGAEISTSRPAQDGIAWIRMTSDRKEGAAKIGAAIGDTSEFRVVQQVASDACNLRIKGDWQEHKFFVETDLVRDCSGNNVPDGTVVSFTKTDAAGKTTVDVPIKKGIARVQMPVNGTAHITVASGVATGNELSVAGGQ
jgi:hypothetical protein